MTQLAAAAAVGVTARTLRSWSRSPGFARALARERERAERARADSARSKPSRRLRRPAADDAERVPGQRQRERHEPPPPDGPRPRQPSSARLGPGGVPLFPNTRAGQAERLAYYEARKLNQLPDSLLDYHDVRRGRETPAKRRAREGGASGRRR